MSDNGATLWSKAVLTGDDVLSLNGQRRLRVSPRLIITPSARDEIREKGIELEQELSANGSTTWGISQERNSPLVESAIVALRREGIGLKPLPAIEGKLPCRWAQALAECIANGECQGGVIFAQDPALICCVANKLPGLRAASVSTIDSAARATFNLQANFLAVEMPGRTWHEIRQILRLACTLPNRPCPEGLACTLRELEQR